RRLWRRPAVITAPFASIHPSPMALRANYLMFRDWMRLAGGRVFNWKMESPPPMPGTWRKQRLPLRECVAEVRFRNRQPLAKVFSQEQASSWESDVIRVRSKAEAVAARNRSPK